MKDFSNAHRTELLDALDGLQPLVADSRGDFDRNRRLPDTLMRALARAGMFRLLLPAGLGGLGLSPLDFMDVVERAASLDGSVGWLVGNGGGMSRAAGMLAEGAAKAIFSDTDCFVAASTGAVGKAVPTGEGFAVSGRWLFGSGSSHATWFAVLCEVDEGQPAGQGRMIFAFVPRSAVTVIDTWHASGLRATASCDFTIADASVPAAFCHDFQPTPTQPGITNRLPTRSIFSWTVATVPLGIATAALSAFRALAAGHRRQGGAVPLAERESVQFEVGRIAARMGAARAYLRSTMGDLCRHVEAGDPMNADVRLELRLAAALAGETASRSVAKLCDIAGAAAVFEASPLERCERDVRAAVKHVAMSPAIYVTEGQGRLGLDISAARF